MGLQWDSRIFFPSDVTVSSQVAINGCISSNDRAGSRKEYYRWLHRLSRDYDAILLRHSLGDFREPFIIGRLRTPVYLVHHTLEGPEISLKRGFRPKVKYAIEHYFGSMSVRRSRAIIPVTKEIKEYQLKRAGVNKLSFLYPNGAKVGNELHLADRRCAQESSFLFVASHFVPWHGLDRLIDAAAQSKDDFKIHVVGEVLAEDRRAMSGDPRFVHHGTLSSAEITTLSEECSIGLASFALDRKGMAEACTLKVRDYLSMGLPVYSGHKDVFGQEFAYYRDGPCEMSQIMNFAIESNKWSKQQVFNASRPLIDKRELLRDLYSFIDKDLRN